MIGLFQFALDTKGQENIDLPNLIPNLYSCKDSDKCLAKTIPILANLGELGYGKQKRRITGNVVKHC